MFESFSKNPKEDEKIKSEIDEIEREYYKKEYKKFELEIKNLERQKRQAHRIITYIENYIIINHRKANRNTSFGEFVDLINEDGSDFDIQTRDLINSWIDKYDGTINFEKSLKNFLDFVEEKGREANS
jgi:enolase